MDGGFDGVKVEVWEEKWHMAGGHDRGSKIPYRRAIYRLPIYRSAIVRNQNIGGRYTGRRYITKRSIFFDILGKLSIEKVTKA